MLASYEAWDPMERTLDQWAAPWPVSKQSFYSAMRAKGLQPKSQRPAKRPVDAREDLSALSMMAELYFTERLRRMALEARLREAGLPTD